MKKRFAFVLTFVFAVSLQTVFTQIRLSQEEAEKLIAFKPPANYSEIAKKLKAQGTVKYELTVGENGVVIKARPIGGHPVLLTSSLNIAKQYRFKPYVVDSKPTAFIATIEIFFSLGSTKEEIEKEEEIARQYFAQSDRCRALMKERKWSEANTVCKTAVSIAEQLPATRAMEKYSAHKAMSYTAFYQKQNQAAIEYSNKALAAAKDEIDDTDSETGEIYFLLGAANHNLSNLERASEFFAKAEETYRKAFVKIDDDEIRQPYPQMIQNILLAHLVTAEELEDKNKIEAIKKRLAELTQQYSKFL
jgi:tetratricopeptide (TPR) repeat protein